MNRRDAIKATLLGAIAAAMGWLGWSGLEGASPAGHIRRSIITEAQGRELVALMHSKLIQLERGES